MSDLRVGVVGQGWARPPMPLTDLDTALQTHRVIFAADRSAETGQPVPLSALG